MNHTSREATVFIHHLIRRTVNDWATRCCRRTNRCVPGMEVASDGGMTYTRGWILAVVLPFAAADVTAQTSGVPRVLVDPAVTTFTHFVDTRITAPLSDAAIVAGLDLLLSAVEGVALAVELNDSTVLDRAHKLRQDARRRYVLRQAPTAKRQALFEEVAALVALLSGKLPPRDQIPQARIEALDRAARSLDLEDPLKKQPDSVERFFRHAAEALRVSQP